MSQGDTKATVTFWRCKDANVPYREIGLDPRTLAMRPDVLRLEVEFKNKNKTEKTNVLVTNFSEERVVGKKKLACVREETEMEGTEEGKKVKASAVRFLSNEVPGREVSQTVEAEFDGKKFKKEVKVEEFEVIKEK